MHAFGALGPMVARVERDVDPLETWEERVGVVEAKGVGWGYEADVVECVDRMCVTQCLVWRLFLRGGKRIARHI
jgi:hypothetical protein